METLKFVGKVALGALVAFYAQKYILAPMLAPKVAAPKA